MSYMVIFQSPDGNPGYNQFEHLDGAVEFVETLRNSQGVENARMFELEEITFEFKPIYKVQMAALEAGQPVEEPVVDVAPPVDEPVVTEPVYSEPPVAEPVAAAPEAPVEDLGFAAPPPPAEPVIDLPSDLPPPPAEPFEAYPPPAAAPVVDGGPSFAPPPPMPPNEVPQAPAPSAEESAQPQRRGLFGR